MPAMSDKWITRMALEHDMISPFVGKSVKMADGVPRISYGLSSYGYDMRCSRKFKIFYRSNERERLQVDPKAFDQRCFHDHEGDYCIIPPNSFALTESMEYFRIPENIIVMCTGKSTYARCGIVTATTPMEPGWCGNLTIEISNSTPLPVKIYAEEGIVQAVFLEGNEPCLTSYASRAGKYQDQREITLPKV